MIKVSDLTSYLTCPKLFYFRMRFGAKLNEMNAVREIYLSLRKGYDLTWAENRFLEMGGNKDIFDKAKERFKFLEELDILNPVDWEIRLESKKYRLKGLLDELVEFRSKLYPLVLSLKSSKNVKFKDKIKISAFCILLEDVGIDCSYGFVYYCYDGAVKRVDIGKKERYYVLKLIEKVERIKKGFVPEAREKPMCKYCEFFESCRVSHTSFEEKFGNQFIP
ncbi:CRISPR-associated protein Cas4 [Archaeoglobus sp.]